MRGQLIEVYKHLYSAAKKHAVTTGNMSNVVKVSHLKLERKTTLTEKEMLDNMMKMARYCKYPEYMYLQK